MCSVAGRVAPAIGVFSTSGFHHFCATKPVRSETSKAERGQIYEVDFKGFSYGFRPGRSPHRALDALTVGIQRKRVNWVLDADIRGFFDNLSHEWTMKFIEHRVADRRILRLIRKWLKAGVSEDGQWSGTKMGTPQGA